MSEVARSCFLSGIRKVSIALADHVVIQYNEMLAPGSKITVDANLTELSIENLASVESVLTTSRGQSIYTTILKFSAGENFEGVHNLEAFLANNNVVFLLTTVYGTDFLMGTPSKPYPTVSVKYVNPSTPSQAQINNYEITLVSTLPLLEVSKLNSKP